MRHKTGDTIVCIDARETHPEIMKHFTHWLTEGKIYKVRGTREFNGIQSVLLEGLKNPPMYNPELFGHCEPGYASIRFRKATSDDILLDQLEKSQKTEIQELQHG
jgi:hypothetical protein